MFVVLCFITCLAPRLVKGQMTVNKEYSFPSSLPLPLLSVPLVSVPLLPAALPPPGEARLPGHGAVGLAGSTLRLITPLILGLPVCLQGKNSGLNPPPLCPNSHPSSVSVPLLYLVLHPLHPSVPVLPEALRDDTKSQLQTGPLARTDCLVRHMSRQMGLPWTLPWTYCKKKEKDKGGLRMRGGSCMSWAIG